jgi:hypothetical protein
MANVYYCMNDECGYSNNTSPAMEYPRCYVCEDAGRDSTNVVSSAEIDCEIQANDSFEEWRD